MKDYQTVNRKAWNDRVSAHLKSEFYDLQGWKAGKTSLKDIELELLGDVSGKSILHLQCHFGQDSLSLARMGATVTGVDLSDEGIEAARKLNDELELNAEFIVSDVLELIGKTDKKFDIVFTSYGTIGWLPDLDKWAETISHHLKPGGQLIFVEFHPAVWMFDDDYEKVAYRYFKDAPIVETSTGTYAAPNADIELKEVSWNHSLSEVYQALKKQGLQITDFNEHDYSPYCLAGMFEMDEGKFVVEKHGNKLPLVYSLVAEK